MKKMAFMAAINEQDGIYNQGAKRHVAVRFECPEFTADIHGMGN